MADTINQNSQGDNTVIVRFEINKFTQLGERGVSAFSRARQATSETLSIAIKFMS